MNLDISEIVSAFLVLFAVIDIVGSIPIILQIRQSAGGVLPLRATLVALGIMVTFLFVGESLLNVFGVDIPSFAVAGSFILFFLSLEMVLGVKIFKDDSGVPGGQGAAGAKVQSIVPIAFPIIAGAGSITTILSLRAEFAWENILVAIILNVLVVYLVIRSSERIERLLGSVGIVILKKAFGVILLAIAVRLFSSNISALFNPPL